ncbi:LysM peptidoglycan-binding domain-containing protein [Pseudomonas tussilaginis]|uniref:LysM peptidoglycan-binding domain-containing protein n=1 Tax=unclassified Pseudomonas TaxID=196821 RepID=UPI001C734448|nr:MULTISPECIES: LysM peptidoglycan-binding domain-containing protein [unclassified Pseudomonas]QYX48370.1 LysM peptidoglycan-binding domain-containing protein [Pseudomonas sp. S11A 273]
MSSTYTVKHGDTLGQIAQRHGAKVSETQALNPIIGDPNHIKAGWELKLPGAASKPELPPPMHAHSTTSIALKGQAECDEELVDVAHITGEPHFYVLTAKQSKALKQEINAVQKLMDELHQNLAKALPALQCKKPQAPMASCTCAGCVKDAWAQKAEGAGLLVRETKPQPTTIAPLTTDKDLQGRLATLQQARDWYQDYKPSALRTTQFESNWKSLQNKKVLELDQEIGKLRAELAAQRAPEPEDSFSTANSAAPDLRHGMGRSFERQQGKQTKTGINVVEIILFSDPTRRHYISIPYRETTSWKVRASTRIMAGKPFNKQLATDLIKDIKEAIGKGRKTGPLGSLELKISSWNSKEDNLLNTLHQEVSWTSNQSDAAPYAVTAEAHALRFAASASAGVNNWNPMEGSIDVGVRGSAALSLAEASASLNSYFPDQGGHVANMSYRNALGMEVLHPVGVFRLSGKLEFSCFVGAKLQGEAGVKTQYKPSETPAGATALLGTPAIALGPSGHIGVKCETFAGAQAGGALSGAFEWVAPDKQGTGKAVVGQANASSNWVALAKISVEGNAALGVGGSGEFGLEISKDRLVLSCRGSMVLGAGAGGGFATVVDIEQIGKLTLLFCNALADMDYRYLLGVTEGAFSYLAAGLYQVATSPANATSKAFDGSASLINRWWEKRSASKAEAQILARYVDKHKTDKVMIVRGELLPFSLLPPETLGPMVYVLTEGFVESFNELQEEALVILLSEIRSWRQFIEVLEHCSSKAEKVNAMESLERINAILDGYEQNQFNRFIENLAINQLAEPSARVAWKPSNAWRKEKVLLAARNSGRFDGLA